jgi:hypothetical protein
MILDNYGGYLAPAGREGLMVEGMGSGIGWRLS